MKGRKVIDQVNNDSSSWSKFINGDDLKIWFRQSEGKRKGLFDFYFEKTAKASIPDVLSVIYNFEDYKKWVPMMYKSEFLHEFTLFQVCSEVGIT